MRYRLKFFYITIIISLLSASAAKAQTNNADTLKLIAAVAKKKIEYKSVVLDANVTFPESLENYKDQTLDYIKKFSDKKRAYLLHTYETGKQFFPKIINVLKKFQLPEELKVLVALESGFSANAVSRAGAVGYWQIMSGVAKAYGLHISSSKDKNTGKHAKKDDRKNFDKSTLFAAKYFRDSQADLNNDLLLMVASYNCGGGRVRSAIKKSGKSDAGFWDIKKYLPGETRKYVMNFIALNVIFQNFEKFQTNQLLFEPQLIAKVPAEPLPAENLTAPAGNTSVD